MQAYSDPKRASDPYLIPDVELYYYNNLEEIFACGYFGRCEECGEKNVELADGFGADDQLCVSCANERYASGWYWRTCFPGCLPDSDPNGPFATQAEALADAQSNADEFEDA